MSEKKTFFNKQRPLMDIEMEGQTVIKIVKIYEENRVFMPIAFYNKLSPDIMNKWLKKRLMPDNRDGLKDLLKYKKYFNLGSFFSLSDQYWIKQNERITWDNGNFFTNKYQTEIGKLFFTPWAADLKEIKKPSPDLTTNGVLRKAWIQNENNQSYLVKTGSVKFHQEPTAEVLTSMMLKKLGVIDYVNYDLEIYGLAFCSKCKNFVNENTEFVTASDLFQAVEEKSNESVVQRLLRACDLFEINGAKNHIYKMIAVDSIIGNSDRHLGNFGFIRDVNNGKFIKSAPLFDSGSSYTSQKQKKNRVSTIFEAEEKSAVEMFLKRIKKKLNVSDMLELVHTFPDFTDEDRKVIRSKIKYTKDKIETEMLIDKSNDIT